MDPFVLGETVNPLSSASLSKTNTEPKIHVGTLFHVEELTKLGREQPDLFMSNNFAVQAKVP